MYVYVLVSLVLERFMSTTEQDLPCLQKPRSYHGQSLIFDSGSMCRNGHSLLLHSPARVNKNINKIHSGHIQSSSSSVGFYETLSQHTKLGVEVAFRHLGHVVFMEKFTLVSFLTESSEPVFTHHRLLPADVTERTHPT